MNLEPNSPATSILQFSCPHCSHEYLDGLELLAADVPHEFTCENCRKPFVVLITECPHCSQESVSVSAAVTLKGQLSPSTCVSCGKSFELFDEVPE